MSSEQVIQKWVADAAQRGDTDIYAGKRDEPRSGWDQTIKVEVADGSQAPLFLRTYDISMTGIAFFSRNEISRGTRLRLIAENPEEAVEATVTQCTKVINGHRIGATFGE